MPRFEIEDLEDLRHARELLETPGLAVKLTSAVGTPIERGLDRLPAKWSGRVQAVVRQALRTGLEFAVRGMDSKPRRSRERRHKLLVAGTGAFGGVLGLASLPVELPVSTVLMLRSIADIARSEGEDIQTMEAKLACLEVFALGGRSSADDAAETGYFAVRAALAQAMSEAARHIAGRGLAEPGASAVVRFISAVAERFGIVVTEKLAATLVPVVGAAGGAAVNLIFMAHFQHMARGHFIIRRLERTYGEEAVRRAYEELA